MRIPLASNVQRSTTMEKGFAFLFSGVVCAGIALVGIACGDSETSTFDNEGVDASTDGGPVFGGSSGNGSSSGAIGEGGTPGAKCEPTIKADYTANFVEPTPQGEGGPCTSTTVGTYYDECLATIGKADHKTRCDAWKSANTACGNCIEPTNNSGPIQWHRDRFYYTLNVAGCLAISQNKFEDTDCGFAYGAAVNCARDACTGCFETGMSTFDDFRECQKSAQGVGLCKSLETQQSSLCTGVTTAADTKQCFNENGKEEVRVHYTRVMSVFCGQ